MPRLMAVMALMAKFVALAMVAQAVVRDWVCASCLDCGAGTGPSDVV